MVVCGVPFDSRVLVPYRYQLRLLLDCGWNLQNISRAQGTRSHRVVRLRLLTNDSSTPSLASRHAHTCMCHFLLQPHKHPGLHLPIMYAQALSLSCSAYAFNVEQALRWRTPRECACDLHHRIARFGSGARRHAFCKRSGAQYVPRKHPTLECMFAIVKRRTWCAWRSVVHSSSSRCLFLFLGSGGQFCVHMQLCGSHSGHAALFCLSMAHF
jgi:hypothetical protein